VFPTVAHPGILNGKRGLAGVWRLIPSRRKPSVVWDKALSCRKQKDLGAEPPALGIFLQFFNKNNAFYAYFGQNSYFKTVIHQLKSVTNVTRVLSL